MLENNREIKRKRKTNPIVTVLISIIIIAVVLCLILQYKVNNFGKSSVSTNVSPLASSEVESSSVSNASNNNSGEWYLTLVNKWNPISTERKITTTKLSNGKRVDTRIYPYLQKMFADAKENGLYLIVASGYRTSKEQKDIYNKKIAEYKKEGLSQVKAKKEAEYWVSVPGTSEHELGLAADINADGIHSKGTEVYKWLEKNAHKYGFIKRYPTDKTNITGVANEPWHYRYVGEKAAEEIYNRGICLEEYLNKVN